jgi:hypothetical protein
MEEEAAHLIQPGSRERNISSKVTPHPPIRPSLLKLPLPPNTHKALTPSMDQSTYEVRALVI